MTQRRLKNPSELSMNSAKNKRSKLTCFKNSEAGFLLLDAIAMTIFLSMIVGALGLYQRTTNIRRETGIRISALYIANSQMSNIRSKMAAGESISDEYLGESSDLTRDGTSFDVETQIEELSQVGIDFKKIRVEVKYEIDGRSQNVALEEIVR